MCKLSMPLHDRGDKRFLFAGLRYLRVDKRICKELVFQFGRLGFSFLTGCVIGVDKSFRLAFSELGYQEHSMVTYAFKDRTGRLRVFTLFILSPLDFPQELHLQRVHCYKGQS